MGVTATGKDIVSEQSCHKMVPMAPNMCKMPSPPPVAPFPLTGDSGKLAPGCKKVFEGDSKKTLNTKGKVKQVTGNEGGLNKDVVTSVTGKKAGFNTGASGILFEGAPVCITGSKGFLNVR